MNGFVLVSLSLTGTGVPDARVDFGEYLNVISGPSDTGKTFILQCLDFAMGAGLPPDTIPEASKHEAVRLQLRPKGGDRVYTMERSLRGGPSTLSTEGEEDRVLGERHSGKKKDTISAFLLGLSGLSGKVVRENKQGKTRTLSFRDIARLAIIDEESIITKRSPIKSGQHSKGTAETNVFRLLLTGVDDSSVVSTEDAKAEQAQAAAERELLEKLLAGLQDRLSGLGIERDPQEIRRRMTRLDESFTTYSAELAARRTDIADLEAERRSAWSELQRVESRLAVLSELLERFGLLQEQYASDLRRLESIAEAGTLLGQLKEERCPVCGASSEHHSSEHLSSPTSAADVAAACNAEGAKLRGLAADLTVTIEDTSTELKSLENKRDIGRTQWLETGREIDEVLKPKASEAANFLSQNRDARDLCIKAIGLLDQIQEFEEALEEVPEAAELGKSETFKTPIGSDEAAGFCKEVQALLEDWRFPDGGGVGFSESDQDLIVADRKRASHGKGVRAVLHAAFNVGLLRYCVRNELPHSGFVVIDSPLVVYREPDADEDGFSPDVKGAFYRALAEQQDYQVIILENEDPPNDLPGSAKVVRFTGSDEGRRGFVPSK